MTETKTQDETEMKETESEKAEAHLSRKRDTYNLCVTGRRVRGSSASCGIAVQPAIDSLLVRPEAPSGEGVSNVDDGA